MVFAIECDRGELSFELGCWLLSVKNSNVCCGKILNCRVIKIFKRERYKLADFVGDR